MTPELIDVLNRARLDLVADNMERSCRDWLEQIVEIAYRPDSTSDNFLNVRLADALEAIAWLEPIMEAWSFRMEPPTFERDWQRFENTTGSRRAYWAIRVTGGEYELHWGLISSKGQRKRKPYVSVGAGELQSLIHSKLSRGYEPATALMPRHQPRPAHRVAWWHRDGELLPRQERSDDVDEWRETERGRRAAIEALAEVITDAPRRAEEEDPLKALAESMAESLLGTARFQQMNAPFEMATTQSFTCGCNGCDAKVHHKDKFCVRCGRYGCNEEWVGCDHPL